MIKMTRLLLLGMFAALVFCAPGLHAEANKTMAIRYLIYGNVLYKQGNVVKAEKYYRQATVLDPENADSWKGLGNALAQLNRPSEAAEAYSQSQKLKLHGATVEGAKDAFVKGMALEKAKNYQEAIAEYQAVLSENPTYIYANKQMGNCYYYLGDKAQAVKNYDIYLAYKKDDAALKAFADKLRPSEVEAISKQETPSPSLHATKTTRFFIEGLFTESTFISASYNYGYNPGIGIGVGAEFYSNRLFQFNLALDYVQRGSDGGTSSGYSWNGYSYDVNTYHSSGTLDYLVLYPSLEYKIPLSSVKPTFLIGVYRGYLIGARWGTSVNSGPVSVRSISLVGTNRIDEGFSVGMGVEFLSNSLFSPYLRARYDFGFTPIDSSSFQICNSGFIFSAGMLF